MKTITGVTTSIVVVMIITILAFRETNWVLEMRHVMGLSAVSCVLYDRPPRTGSTTIARALEVCFRTKGYELVQAQNRQARTEVVNKMMLVTGRRIGAVKGHLYMSRDDLRSLKAGCDQLLYISSCRPMLERLYSSIKYQLFPGHGNATLSNTAVLNAVQNASTEKQERSLERYPYLRNVDEKDRMVPDYVIRSERLESDMTQLFSALRCTNQLKIDNVHEVVRLQEEVDEKGGRYNLSLKLGDARFKMLHDLAEARNAGGLLRAMRF